MTELLKQGQYSPLAMEEQVIVIYAGTNGFVDDLPLSALARYESELLSFIKSRKPTLLESVRTSGKLDTDAAKEACTEFGKQFSVDAKKA